MKSFPVIVTCLTMLLTASPVSACDDCGEARALMQGGECKDAIKLLKKTVKAAPKEAEAYALLAMCHARLGKPKAVLEAAINCLEAGASEELVNELVRDVAANLKRPQGESIEFDAPDGVTAPVLLIQPRPVYPEVAAEMGMVADIRVSATIGEDGAPKDLSIIKSADSVTNDEAGLHEAALNAVLGWRFLPGLAGSVPAAVKMTCTVRFGAGT
ncbi:MAG: TonB family protein [Acidobacteria bacterium]|nr:TonB family protein [Acidobacteriota bacterium]